MHTRFIHYFIIFVYTLFSINATSIDGTSSLKYQSTHYVLRDTNTVTGYVRFANGFTILPATNHASTATMDTCISCSGGFDLRETSTLKLIGDLTLDSATTLTSGGKIYGYNRSLILKDNLTLSANKVLHLDGNLMIDGCGHDIFIDEYAQFMFDNGATVTIQNATVHNKRNYPGRPALNLTTTLCRLTLSDVELALDSDLYINSGQLFIHNDVAVTGTSALVWHSVGPCTFEPNATLYFDLGTTFSYAPPCADKNLIRMTDQSSTLHLNGCSLLATHTGLRLATGTVIFDNRITINSTATNKLDSVTTVTQANLGGYGRCLSWTTDGKYLALGVNGGFEGNRIYVYRFNNLLLTPITSVNYEHPEAWVLTDVQWSRDNKYLAATGYRWGNNQELQVYSFDGSALSLVDYKSIGNQGMSSDWSPDGKYIAVALQESVSGINELQIFTFDGKKLQLVTSQNYAANTGELVQAAKWSPDGKYIAIGGWKPIDTLELQIFRFNGSTLTTVTSLDYGDDANTRIRMISWSPDGQYLAIGGAFPTLFGGIANTNELQIYRFNGSSLTAITSQNYGTYIYNVTWSPDGKYIGISGSEPDNNNELQIYKFDGSLLTSIIAYDYGASGVYTYHKWSPDEKYLGVAGSSPNQLRILSLNYLNETATQAASNGILFGNSSAGASQDATVKILAGTQVVVNGILNVDAA